MPTNLDRVQVLMQPDVYAKMRTIAKYDRRTYSALCAELIEKAMTMPKYRALYEEALAMDGEVPVKPDPRIARKQEQLRKESYVDLIPKDDAEMVERTGIDKLTPERLRELQELLGLLEEAQVLKQQAQK